MKRSPSNSAGRAPAGGQVGKNGEFYKGGAFLPNTTLPKGGKTTRANQGRGTLIEPGVFDHAPDPALHSIFGALREFFAVEDGVASVTARPDAAIAFYVDEDVEKGRQIIQAAVDAYNRGDRWFESHDQLLAGYATASSGPVEPEDPQPV